MVMENPSFRPEIPDAEQRIPDGASVMPEAGRQYKTLELPEGTLALNYNEYKLTNGLYIEVDEKGQPKSKFVREWFAKEDFKGKLI